MRSGFLQFLILPVMIPVLAQPSPMPPIRDTRITQVTGSLTLTNIGFAPIPAFSFNGPMIAALLSLKKGRFRYDLAHGFNRGARTRGARIRGARTRGAKIRGAKIRVNGIRVDGIRWAGGFQNSPDRFNGFLLI